MPQEPDEKNIRRIVFGIQYNGRTEHDFGVMCNKITAALEECGWELAAIAPREEEFHEEPDIFEQQDRVNLYLGTVGAKVVQPENVTTMSLRRTPVRRTSKPKAMAVRSIFPSPEAAAKYLADCQHEEADKIVDGMFGKK